MFRFRIGKEVLLIKFEDNIIEIKERKYVKE